LKPSASITGDALSAKHLNDTAALSYVIELVTERFQQYDLLNLFSKFPVLDMAKISTGEAWTSTFINLFKWLNDLELETVCKSVKWIRQYLNDIKWTRDLSWSREILLKACTSDLKETIMGEEQALAVQDRAFQGGPITLVLIIKQMAGLTTRAMKQLYKYVAKINLKSIVGEDITKITHQLRTVLKRFSSCSVERFVIPPTCYEDIVGTFTTSSCEDFNAAFRALLTQHELGAEQFTYHRVFDIADDLYRKHQDKWVPAVDSGQNGFLGAKGDVICHNCSQPGHMARDCPEPRKRSGGGDLGPNLLIQISQDVSRSAQIQIIGQRRSMEPRFGGVASA